MLKLFSHIGLRITLYCAATALGIWFYFEWQEPSLFNQILFGVFGICLLASCSIDIKVAIERLLKNP